MGTKMAKFTYFKTIKAWDCAIFFQNRVEWQHLSHFSLSLSGQNPLQMILVLVLCKTLTPPLATDHLSSNCIDPFLKMFLYPLLCLLPNGTSAMKLSPLQLKSTFPQISPNDDVTKTWCTPKTVKVFLKVKCKCQIPDRTEAFRSYNCNEKCLQPKIFSIHAQSTYVHLNQKLSQWSRLSRFRISGGTSF